MLQSWEWGEFRRRQGWTPLRLLDPEGNAACQVLLRGLPGLGPIAYAPHGPLNSDPKQLPGTASEVAGLVKDRGAFLLEVEPKVAEDLDYGFEEFVRLPSSIQPRCTLVTEVLEDPDEQLAALPKDTRYGIRRAGREGVVAGPSENVVEDLEEFVDLLESTASRQRFALRPREYYRQFMRALPAALITGRHQGRLVAGAIVLTFGGESCYLYGATDPGNSNLYASYLVQWEAMAAARREGIRRYDLWGIPCEPHKEHPLWGVYQFKKKFGSHHERYIGAHEIRLSPLRSRLARKAIEGYYALQRLRGRSLGPISD